MSSKPDSIIAKEDALRIQSACLAPDGNEENDGQTLQPSVVVVQKVGSVRSQREPLASRTPHTGTADKGGRNGGGEKGGPQTAWSPTCQVS